MSTRSTGGRSSVPSWRDLGPPGAEVLGLVVLVAAAGLLVGVLPGREMPERAVGSLAFGAGVAATILLAVAAWVGGNRRVRRVAAAVGLYTGVTLLMRAVGADTAPGAWELAGSVAMTGTVGLLLLALRVEVAGGPAGRRRDRAAALGVLAFVAGGLGVVALTSWAAGGHRPPEVLVATADAVAWSGVGALGVVMLLVGVRTTRPLLRRTGLAFAALGAAHGVRIGVGGPSGLAAALELGAVALLLVAAGSLLAAAVRSVGVEQARSRSRLAEVEAAMASVAERDHELRNVVAGLAGAAQVLGGDGDPVASQALLLAARAELRRLQVMLDGSRAVADVTPVGPMLRHLAVVHATTGLDVDIDADDRLEVAVAPDVVAQVLTNLLSNCARHAPGAGVRLRATGRGHLVRIEVADDGPGMPGGAVRDALRRGVRRPGSPGSGLGLPICADLVRESAGTLTLTSGPSGTRVRIEWPATISASDAVAA